MSNSLAVATVTAAFGNHLARFIDDPDLPGSRDKPDRPASIVPGARVTTLHPGTASLRDGDPLVNLYLFRVTRNPFEANHDLPTRAAGGRALASPTARLDLDYMITFFGDDTRLETHRLLGGVVAGLHAAPALDQALVQATIAHTPWLAGSTLGERAAPITIMPMSLPPDAMARLWSEFVNQPYQLTVLYTVSAIGLEVPLTVAPALPVRRIGLDVQPAGPIVIRGVVDADHPDLPVSAGCNMAVRTADPGRPGLHVQLNGIDATGVKPGRDAGGHACLIVPLTAAQPAGLTVGRLSVLVRQTAHDGRTVIARSPEMPVPLRPALAGDPAYDAAGRTVTLRLALAVAAHQTAALLLFPMQSSQPAATGGTTSVRIDLPAATAPADTLVFPIPRDVHGRYLVMVECGGLQSLPAYVMGDYPDYAKGGYVSPMLDIEAAA